MKKIFTLIAAAMMAAGAYADATWSWTWSGTAPTDNKETVVVDNYGTVNIAYAVGDKTDVFSSTSGIKFSGSAVTMTITLPEGKYFTDGDKFTVATKGANSNYAAQLSVGGQLTTAHAASTSEEINSEITLPSTFTASNTITISRSGSGTCYLKSIEFTSAGKTPVVATVWNFGSIYTGGKTFTKSTKTEASGTYDAISVDGSLYAIANEKMGDASSSKTWSTGAMTYTLKTGSTGDVVEGKVQGNGLLFKVSAGSTIKVCAMASNSEKTRKLVLKNINGTEIGNSLVAGGNPSSSTDPVSFNYTGTEPATLYLYAATPAESETGFEAGGINFYYVSATNTVAMAQADVDALLYTKPTAINEVNASASKANNGVVKTANYIIKGGKKYNYAGQQMK